MGAKRSEIKTTDLVPEHWGLTVKNEEDLLFFGQATIREMIRSWRNVAQKISANIGYRESDLSLFEGKSAADFRACVQTEAVAFSKSPDFPRVGVPDEDNPGGYRVPLDSHSKNRERNATKFNCCGWCRHAAGREYRNNVMIVGSCGFRTHAGLQDEERYFDTPCFLKKATDEVINEIREANKSKRDQLIEEKREVDEKIKFLLSLEKRAERKPVLAKHRPRDWFENGNKVACRIGDRNNISCDCFESASVFDVRHQWNGPFVFALFDRATDEKAHIDGYIIKYDALWPGVMHVWELEYLLAHPDFCEVWESASAVSAIKDRVAERK